MSASILEVAHAFHAAGIAVVPPRPDGSKAPVTTWKTFQATPPTIEQVDRWYAIEQYQGLGVITGAVSGHLECVELEGRAVEDGFRDQLWDLARQTGLDSLLTRVALGYTEQSPSGGIHILYRCPDGIEPNQKLARRHGDVMPESGRPAVEVLAETRGEGGFLIVAPSNGSTHPSGKPWVMLQGGVDTIVTITADERRSLLDLFRALDRMPVAVDTTDEQPRPAGPTIKPEDDTRPGTDFNAKASWDEILRPEGWTRLYTDRDKVTYWRRPGKKDGLSATTGRNDGDNLFVFSSSTLFDPETPYSKFHAYALLHHHGDFAAAARDLAAQGYGRHGSPTETVSADSLVTAPGGVLKVVQVDSKDAAGPISADEALALDPERELDIHWWEVQRLVDEYLRGSDPDGHRWGKRYADLSWLQTGIFPEVPPPVWGKRTDGIAMFYEGKVNLVYGEPETGKSWLALIAGVEALQDGKRFAYIDADHNGEVTMTSRLARMGAPLDALMDPERFRLYSPQDGKDLARDFTDIIHWHADEPGLVILDSYGEILPMMGASSQDNDEVSDVNSKTNKQLARLGCCVVLIDHLPKNNETRNTAYAIGAQAKKRAIDGVSIQLETLAAPAPGHVGRIAINGTKDRNGQLRKECPTSGGVFSVGTFILDSTNADITTWEIQPPLMDSDTGREKLTGFWKKITLFLQDWDGPKLPSKAQVEKGIHGNNDKIREAIDQMVAESFVEVVQDGQARRVRLIRPYEDRADLLTTPPTSPNLAHLARTSPEPRPSEVAEVDETSPTRLHPPLRGVGVGRGSTQGGSEGSEDLASPSEPSQSTKPVDNSTESSQPDPSEVATTRWCMACHGPYPDDELEKTRYSVYCLKCFTEKENAKKDANPDQGEIQ